MKNLIIFFFLFFSVFSAYNDDEVWMHLNKVDIFRGTFKCGWQYNDIVMLWGCANAVEEIL